MMKLFERVPQAGTPATEGSKMQGKGPEGKTKVESTTAHITRGLVEKNRQIFNSLPAVAQLATKEKQLDLFKKLVTRTQDSKDLEKAAALEQEVLALKDKVAEEEKLEEQRRARERKVEEMMKALRESKENLSKLVKMGLDGSFPIAKGLLFPMRKLQLPAAK